MPAGGEDDGVHGAGPQQAQVRAGRGEGALPLLRLQGEVLAERPAPPPPLRDTPGQDWKESQTAPH